MLPQRLPLVLLPALLALALAGCGAGLPAETLVDSPAAPVRGGAPAAGPAMPDGLPTARVTRVVDGDTLDVRIAGQVERVRLIGINTPESVDPRRPVECFGREASANAKRLLEGQDVALEEDPSQDSQDRNGRLLRYVWLPDGRLLNYEQIAQGYGFEYTYNVPYRYQAAFRQAERDARAAGQGLWAPNTCAGERGRPADAGPPPDRGRPADAGRPPDRGRPTAAPQAGCDPAYPDGCIPPSPPDLDCRDVEFRRFTVRPPDPHRFDVDGNGLGCEGD